MLDQKTTTLDIDTPGRGLLEITAPVARWVERTGLRTGLLTLFVRHTSASLLIQENADPDVQADLERFFARLVPDGEPLTPPPAPAGAAPAAATATATRHLARRLSLGAPRAAAPPAGGAAPDRPLG